MELLVKILVCFLAGAGAGIGTGFAGMSAAAVIGPILMTFLGVPAYQAVGIGLASDVLASATSAWTYKKHKNLDVKNSLPLLISVLVMTLVGSFVASLLPERAMSGTMQIAMIFIGLRFLLKPVKTTKEQMAAGHAEGTPHQIHRRRCPRRIYLWLRRRGRRHDAAVRFDVVPRL